MATAELKAEPRTISGKKVSQVRRAGMVPGVIYGKSEAQSVQVNTLELAAVLRKHGRSVDIALQLEGETRNVTVQELQRHLTRGDLMHIDFLEA